MALSIPLPPWLNIGPDYFTSALEAGARAGLAVSEQAQRAQALAEARAERAAQMQERADRAAQQQQQFEASRLLDVQKLAQDAQALQQKQTYETARESRLMDFEKGRLALDLTRADTAEKRNEALDKMANLRLNQQKLDSDLRAKHYAEIEKHNQDVLAFAREKSEKEKPVTVTQNIYDPENPFVAIGTVRGTQDQLGMPGMKKPLSVEKAQEFVDQAGGDFEKARKMARDAGYTF